jgi:hypothetical protein
VRIPEGRSEAEVLAAIEHAVSLVAPKFVFGPNTLDDIRQ